MLENLRQIKERTVKQLRDMDKEELINYIYFRVTIPDCGENRKLWERQIHELRSYQKEKKETIIPYKQILYNQHNMKSGGKE